MHQRAAVLHTAALAAGGDLATTQAICGAGTDCGGCLDAVAAVVAGVRVDEDRTVERSVA